VITTLVEQGYERTAQSATSDMYMKSDSRLCIEVPRASNDAETMREQHVKCVHGMTVYHCPNH
jgi:hypothetical protein